MCVPSMDNLLVYGQPSCVVYGQPSCVWTTFLDLAWTSLLIESCTVWSILLCGQRAVCERKTEAVRAAGLCCCRRAMLITALTATRALPRTNPPLPVAVHIPEYSESAAREHAPLATLSHIAAKGRSEYSESTARVRPAWPY